LDTPLAASTTCRRRLYFAAIYDATCREAIPSELSAIVPTATRYIFEKKEARGSVGFLMLPSNAVGGSLTWLKYVNEWLRGREPPRGGKTLGEGSQQLSGKAFHDDGGRIGTHLILTPGVMDCPLCSWKTNGFMPWSSPFTMVRANTIEMQGKPGPMGDVGGMYLAIASSDLSLWGHPGPG
jgi:hypothetical protein